MAEITLFISAFLAATLLPFSSEAAFVFALSKDMPFLSAMVSASAGNVLAIIMNYYLGYFLYTKTKKKLLKSKIGRASLKMGKKYTYILLLLSWMPLIGDPLTLVAGLSRVRFILFLSIAGSLRVVRYYVVSLML